MFRAAGTGRASLQSSMTPPRAQGNGMACSVQAGGEAPSHGAALPLRAGEGKDGRFSVPGNGFGPGPFPKSGRALPFFKQKLKAFLRSFRRPVGMGAAFFTSVSVLWSGICRKKWEKRKKMLDGHVENI